MADMDKGGATDELCLRGVLDIDRIESILRSLHTRLKDQEQEIGALREELAKRASSSTLDTTRHGIDRALEAVDKRFVALESRFQRIESCNSRVGATERSLEMLERAVERKADADEVQRVRSEGQQSLGEAVARLQTGMSDADSVARLETIQRQLAKQLSAVQDLLACKVDRVEIPLLQSAGERVRAAEQFCVDAAPRLDLMQRALDDIQSELNAKEEKSAIVERMQAIYHELQQRVEIEWAEAHLEAPLDEVRKRLEVLQCDVELLQPVEAADTLRELRDVSSQAKTRQEACERKVQCLETMLKSRASVRLLEKKADRTYCEQLVHEVSLAVEQRMRRNDKAMENLSKQILQLKNVQTAVDKKLSVSMRFLDWFSSVSLDKGAPPGFGL